MCYFKIIPQNYENEVYRRRLHVLLSLSGKALQAWRLAAPIFIACSLTITRFQSTSQASEITKALDLSLFDGIIVVGSDDQLHEILNA